MFLCNRYFSYNYICDKIFFDKIVQKTLVIEWNLLCFLTSWYLCVCMHVNLTTKSGVEIFVWIELEFNFWNTTHILLASDQIYISNLHTSLQQVLQSEFPSKFIFLEAVFLPDASRSACRHGHVRSVITITKSCQVSAWKNFAARKQTSTKCWGLHQQNNNKNKNNNRKVWNGK